MAWAQITNDDVLDGFTPQEQSALANIDGAQDKLSSILARVLTSVRGKIVAGDVPLGPAGMIPDQLQMTVVDIARWRWLISFPQMAKLQTRERKDVYDEAMKQLSRIESGEMKIEDPNSQPGDPQAWTILPKVQHRPKTAGPGREDGL